MNTNAQAVAFLALVRTMAMNCLSNLAALQKLTQMWSGEQIFNVIPNDASVIQDNNALLPVTDAMVNTMISDVNTIIAAYSSAIQSRLAALASGKVIPPI